jgi:hypothetical protein
MKNLLTLLLLLVAGLSYSQQVYNLDRPKEEKTEQSIIGKSKETKDKAIYQGKEYPVYITEKGKLFIIVTSKKGNLYKKYITTEK